VTGKDREKRKFDLTIGSDETAKRKWEGHQANDGTRTHGVCFSMVGRTPA
jgi:hypothetical protein